MWFAFWATGSAVDVDVDVVDAMAPEKIDKLTIERIASWENNRIMPAAGELATVCFEIPRDRAAALSDGDF